MLDFDVQRFTRVCARSGHTFQPGERFYSVLIRRDGNIERQDIAMDQWTDPPADCIAWWQSEVPDPKSRKLHWAPDEIMFHYFADTEGDADREDVRYVLTLLMIRRRILRLISTQHGESRDEWMEVESARDETRYQVKVVQPTSDRIQHIQTLISELLVDAGAASS